MKFLISVLILLFSFNLGLTQSKQMQIKADEKVEEINQLIVSVDSDLGLTEDQVAMIRELTIQKLMDLKQVKKSDLSEEDKKMKRKELHKAVGKKINQEVLTKEQRKAKAKAKKDKDN